MYKYSINEQTKSSDRLHARCLLAQVCVYSSVDTPYSCGGGVIGHHVGVSIDVGILRMPRYMLAWRAPVGRSMHACSQWSSFVRLSDA